jgi:hypothetical protein
METGWLNRPAWRVLRVSGFNSGVLKPLLIKFTPGLDILSVIPNLSF